MTLKQSQNGRGSQDNTSRSPENIDLEFAQTPTIPNLISQVMPGNMMSISTAMALQRTVGNRQTHQLLTPLSVQTPTVQRKGEGEGLQNPKQRLSFAQAALNAMNSQPEAKPTNNTTTTTTTQPTANNTTTTATTQPTANNTTTTTTTQPTTNNTTTTTTTQPTTNNTTTTTTQPTTNNTTTATTQPTKTNPVSLKGFVDTLLNKVNDYLEKEGVKKVIAFSDTKFSGNQHGEFSPKEWIIIYNPNLELSSHEQYDALANTIYHESRHAEQFFKIMQLFAYKKLDAAAISRVTNMDGGTFHAAAIKQAIDNKNAVKTWSKDVIKNVKSWYAAIYDMSFDDACKQHAHVQGAQATRFNREGDERSRLTTRIREVYKLRNMAAATYKDPKNPQFDNKYITIADEVGAEYPSLLKALRNAAATKDIKKIQEAALNILNQTNADEKIYQNAHDQYMNYAHEKDAYAAGDSISDLLTRMHIVPPLPEVLNVTAWKKAIEIDSGIFKPNNTGGKNIQLIMEALQAVVSAHAQAMQQKDVTLLFKPLVNLETAIKNWLALKKEKTNERLGKRRGEANKLLYETRKYRENIAVKHKESEKMNNSQ